MNGCAISVKTRCHVDAVPFEAYASLVPLTTSMERRDFLRAFGVATAVALLPHDAVAAWSTVGTRLSSSGVLTGPQLASIGAIADTILPRTDSPSATDVKVPAFIDVIVSEQYTDADRDAFIAGLAAIDGRAKELGGASFGGLAESGRRDVITALEAETNRRADPARTYWRLKDLIIYGYFTSEPVMKTVLKTEIMPGRFDGAAPMPVQLKRSNGGDDAHA